VKTATLDHRRRIVPARTRTHELSELARLGTELFEQRIQPTLGPEEKGKFVAIDVDTGEFEIDPDDYTAVMRLRGRIPAAEIWLACAGYPTTYRMGWRSS
jgi:hypothetical protein